MGAILTEVVKALLGSKYAIGIHTYICFSYFFFMKLVKSMEESDSLDSSKERKTCALKCYCNDSANS